MIDELPSEDDQFETVAKAICIGLVSALSLIIGTVVWSWLS